MNKHTREQWEAVIFGLVNEDAQTTDDSLHEVIRLKTQSIILGERDDLDDEDVAVKGKVGVDDDEECPECGHVPCECDDESGDDDLDDKNLDDESGDDDLDDKKKFDFEEEEKAKKAKKAKADKEKAKK